jgi:ABC-type uncharacterized transport system substrate-binding protein
MSQFRRDSAIAQTTALDRMGVLKRNFQQALVPALATIGFLAFPGQALVHPHVFAEARLEVAVDADGGVEALRHVWRFDDLFSSTVLLEFDANADLQLDDAELREVASTVHASLAEFDYFQMVTAHGKDVAMQPPGEIVAMFQDSRLLILFESQPAEPLPLTGTVSFGVYDPTFYTAIEFLEDENMAVMDLPAGCTRIVVRPDPEEALAQNQDTLTEAFFDDPGGNDVSKLFATRLELTCAAQG